MNKLNLFYWLILLNVIVGGMWAIKTRVGVVSIIPLILIILIQEISKAKINIMGVEE